LPTALLVFAGCFGGTLLSARLNFPGIPGTLLFPPYAVLAAAMLVTPRRSWWPLILASAVGNFVPHLRVSPPALALLAEVPNVTRALVIALAMHRFARPSEPFDSLRGTVVFLISAVAVAPAVAAVIAGPIVMAFVDRPFSAVFFAWFLSNALTAVTLLVPLWLLAAKAARFEFPHRRSEALALTLGLLGTGAAAFVLLPAHGAPVAISMIWPVPFLVWAAVRFGPTAVSTSFTAVAGLVLAGAIAGHGPFLGASPVESVLHLQLFLIGMAIPLLLVSALVGHLRRSTSELSAARDDERRKDEFIAMLGHELRNPLAPIGVALELLETSDPHRLASARDVIARQVGQMERLVGDLLDISRSTRGQVRLWRRPVDLGVLAEQSIETVLPLLESRRHHFGLNQPARPVMVEADGARLTQVVVNLLTNACKYTEPGGNVTLTVRADGGDAIISVQDDGIGLDDEMRERVFELFERGERASELAVDGLGVGLTLARRLVALHGGTLTAHSKGKGLGSEFVVRLPLRMPAPHAVEPEPSVIAAPPAAGASHAALQVLVIDDNTDTAELLGELIGRWGHSVRVAHAGAQALAMVRASPPDVVLSDVGLPDLSGLELARLLRSEPATSNALLVAITGHDDRADRRRSAEAGFNHHLVKPIDVRALEVMLAQTAQARVSTAPAAAP
jgi:signal transduction histidine kinase/ActR/RegA family two-component response regulator